MPLTNNHDTQTPGAPGTSRIEKIEKTAKLKLIPLTKRDKRELISLLKDYTEMLREALEIVMKKDIRSRKKAHEACYEYLRRRYPHLHSKYVQEAYKRALAMYKSYRKLLRKWQKLPKRQKRRISPPSPPSIGENKVIELHVDTYRLKKLHQFSLLRVSKGSGDYMTFLVMEYEHAEEMIKEGELKNSRILVDDGGIYLLLTVRKEVEVSRHANKLIIDINEDTVDCLLIDRGAGKALLFTVRHDIRGIRMNYRRIRKGIQMKTRGKRGSNVLLARYGGRERKRVEDRLKKVTTMLAELCAEFGTDLVREDLRDLKSNSKRRSRQLNYRLATFPYRKFIGYVDYKFYERGLDVITVDPEETSITCPICGYADSENRVNKEVFRCRRCGFTFNAQYVACLNIFSRLDEGEVVLRGGRLCLILREAGFVVLVDVAPHEVQISDDALREKPVRIVTKVIKV